MSSSVLHTPRIRTVLILLQTSLMRALSPSTPTYIFPAMNTLMYEHPLTAEHLRVLREVIRYNVVGPIGKTLACGDIGKVLPLPRQVLIKSRFRSWGND